MKQQDLPVPLVSQETAKQNIAGGENEQEQVPEDAGRVPEAGTEVKTPKTSSRPGVPCSAGAEEDFWHTAGKRN